MSPKRVDAAPIRLGINIDHVATLRNARGQVHPDPLRAAAVAIEAGADNITAHLREDRRHIRDSDIERLVKELSVPLNMEMAVTPEMVEIALRHRPHASCLVPERREELTTEGGLDVKRQIAGITPFVAKLRDAGIQVAMFIDADPEQIAASKAVGADAVELHTGTYCESVLAGDSLAAAAELRRLMAGAKLADAEGLEVHAGHGLDYDTVPALTAIPQVVELNIGHFLIGEAVFVGLRESVARMRDIMDVTRAEVQHG